MRQTTIHRLINQKIINNDLEFRLFTEFNNFYIYAYSHYEYYNDIYKNIMKNMYNQLIKKYYNYTRICEKRLKYDIIVNNKKEIDYVMYKVYKIRQKIKMYRKQFGKGLFDDLLIEYNNFLIKYIKWKKFIKVIISGIWSDLVEEFLASPDYL